MPVPDNEVMVETTSLQVFPEGYKFLHGPSKFVTGPYEAQS